MIAKGIKNPATGETIEIQGAGYAFDENKNALMHGEGLTADGSGQVVLGRYNQNDANKALIVGGGIGQDVHRFTIAPFTWRLEDGGDIPHPGKYDDGFVIKPHIIEAMKIRPKNFDSNKVKEGEPWPFWLVINVLQDAELDWDKTAKSEWGAPGTGAYKNKGNFKVGHILRLMLWTNEYVFTYAWGEAVTYKDGYIIFPDGRVYNGSNWYKSYDYNETGDDCLSAAGWNYVVSDEAINSKFENILSVDWVGNMTISGKMEASGDINLKISEGKEISVAELNDSFDALQNRLDPILVELDTSGEVITAYHEGDDFHDLFSDNFLNKIFYVRVRLHCLDEDVYVVATAYRYNDGTDKVVDISLGSNVLRITKHSDDSDDITLISVDEMFLTINESES